MAEEQAGLSGTVDGNREYDYNNLAIDETQREYKISVLDGGLSVSSGTVYEDDKPWQHTGNDAQKPGGITIALTDNDNTGEHIGAIDGAAGADAPAIQVTFSFSPDPAHTPLGSFTHGTHTYALGNGIAENGDGTYTLNVPASHIGANTDSVTLQYHAHGNDDTDLSVSKVVVGAVADGSGVTGSYTTDYAGGNPLVVQVDAVADRPDTGQAVTNIDLDGKGYTAVAYGDAISVKVSAAFTDMDGSEKHYLLLEAKTGWTCSNAEGTVTCNGVTYFYVTADTASAEHTFEIKAPADSSQGTLTDGPLSFSQGGLAVEGEIENGTIQVSGSAKQEESGLSPALDPAYGNNVAFDGKNTVVNVNVINSKAQGVFTAAYEDHNQNQHTGGTVQSATDGTVTLGIGDGTAIGQGGATGEHMTDASFSFEFGDKTAGEIPGTFTCTIDGRTYTLEPNTSADANGASYTFSGGKWSVTLPPASFTNAGTNAADSVTFRYNPAANDSTDLKNFDYTIKIAADNSSATDTLTGSGALVVDAVADQAKFAGIGSGDIDTASGGTVDGDTYEYATPGEDVFLKADVTFQDHKDDSERHYLLVEAKAGWGAPTSVTITDEDGNSVVIALSSGSCSTQMYNGVMYYKIEIDNGAIGESGTVSVSVTITSPPDAKDATFQMTSSTAARAMTPSTAARAMTPSTGTQAMT